MKKINSQFAPKAIGPYSQATIIGNTLYSSGQIPLIPETMKLIEGDITVQTEQVCKNLGAVLADANMSFKDVVKTTIFLKNMGDFTDVNMVYSTYFSHCPSRSTVEVAQLPLGSQIEIEVIAIQE